MQTFHKNDVDKSPIQFKSGFSRSSNSQNGEKRLKIREFISWTLCFAVIGALTGLMKFLQVGVTMDAVTSALFYLSLAGFVYFLIRIVILLTKRPVQLHHGNQHELN